LLTIACKKQVTLNKSSLLLKIDLQKELQKLIWKLFSKVIEKPSKEAWVLDRQSV
jgi:hypothetical protein